MSRCVKGLVLAGMVGVGLLAGGSRMARADILPGAGGPTVINLGGGLFQYDYHPFVTETQRVETGDYFTIYDFPGLVTALAPPNWDISIQNLGLTPLVIPNDSAALPNVTFTRTGGTIVGGPTPLGIFSLVSTWTNPVFQPRNWAGAGTSIASGLTNANLNHVKVPNTAPAPAPVPEPGSMALLGLGATSLLGRLRRRFRKA
jgi:hypothetical protein